MKMDQLAGSKNDEFYTPEYAVKPILKYLPAGSKIWCPFDLEDSYFVKMLKAQGHEVINTHITTGQDFFETDMDCDFIVSNPPYSKKTQVLERLFQLKKPFAMLMSIAGIFESKVRFNMFKNNNLEVIMFDKRVDYFKDYADQKKIGNTPFSSIYICSGVLPKAIIFEEISK